MDYRKKSKNSNSDENILNEDMAEYKGFVSIPEDEKLFRDALRSGTENLSLFKF